MKAHITFHLWIFNAVAINTIAHRKCDHEDRPGPPEGPPKEHSAEQRRSSIQSKGLVELASLAPLQAYTYPFGPGFWLKRLTMSPKVNSDRRSSLCVANNGSISSHRRIFSGRGGFQLRVSSPTRKCGPVFLRFPGGSPIKRGDQDEQTENVLGIFPPLDWAKIYPVSLGVSLGRAPEYLHSLLRQPVRKLLPWESKDSGGPTLAQQIGCPWGEKLKTHP